MLKSLLGRGRTAGACGPRSRNYEKNKRLAAYGDAKGRRRLAQRQDTQPEILYYLAEDEEPAVRRAVAGNAATPAQANLLLSGDSDDEVRCDLARKIARLLPDLSPSEQTRVRERTIEVLEVLARDQLPRVRQILADELKHSDCVPRHIVRRLAEDVEDIVAVPVLEYSPLLNDHDLLEIIAGGAAQGALSAIARRREVSAPVSDAIVATLDVPAVAALLANPSAQIREETLDAIIDNAAAVECWHEPLVLRAGLSLRAMRRIAGFVALSLVDILVQRHDLDPRAVDELNRAVRRRIEESEFGSDELPDDRVRRLAKAGRLDDESLADAIERGEADFVKAALASMASLAPDAVARILGSNSPNAVTALAWKAGLSMRTAMRLQLRTAHIPPTRILNARNGFDYPLSEEEMRRNLDLLVG